MGAPLTGPLVEVVTSGLNSPWEIVFLPGGELLVTERSGNLVLIGRTATRIQVPNVEQRGEGGLLGLALDPDYAANNRIYVYLTALENGQLVNRVERYVFKDGTLSDRRVIFEGILGASNHDGGRIEFGPDGYLYITTGRCSKILIPSQDITSCRVRFCELPARVEFLKAIRSRLRFGPMDSQSPGFGDGATEGRLVVH